MKLGIRTDFQTLKEIDQIFIVCCTFRGWTSTCSGCRVISEWILFSRLQCCLCWKEIHWAVIFAKSALQFIRKFAIMWESVCFPNLHQCVCGHSSVTKPCPTLCDPWTAACQASLSFTIFQTLLKLTCIELVMLSNHVILCRPLLILPSIFPNSRVFSNKLGLHIR